MHDKPEGRAGRGGFRKDEVPDGLTDQGTRQHEEVPQEVPQTAQIHEEGRVQNG